MDGNDDFLRTLGAHVFFAPERWGWEYREPEPERPSPELESEPLWYEPEVVPELPARVGDGLPVRVGVCGGVLLVGLLLGKYGIVLDLAAIVLAGVWVLPLLRQRQQTTAPAGPQSAQVTERDQAWAGYSRAWEIWRASVQSWNAGEHVRVTQADLWHPVLAGSPTSRVDVFGGGPDGWAALLTTIGASTVRSGNSILLLDLSEHHVSRELLDLARSREQPATVRELPAELGSAALFQGLAADDVAEIIAEAVHSGRDVGAADLRGTDAEMLRSVVERLDQVTFRKISAGLQVLRRSYDTLGTKVPALSPVEFQRLAEHVDAIGQNDQTQQELRVLSASVDLLAGHDQGPDDGGSGGPDDRTGRDGRDGRADQGDQGWSGFWPTGISVIRTTDHNQRRKDFIDRVLVQTVIHRLRMRPAATSSDVLFLVGGDHLGLPALEALARQAKRSGLRSVLVLEHLRGDLTQLLGGSDSTSVIMRMGNATEAAAAAEFIGRGHTFVLNQVTRQLSDAATEGEAKQWGASGSVSDTNSQSAGLGWSRSTSITRADTWSRTVNWSTTKTESEGVTTSRVYEFTVEPTQIQGMPMTAFIFVEATGGRRRVIAGDCNPAVSLFERVAGRPEIEAEVTGGPADPVGAPASAALTAGNPNGDSPYGTPPTGRVRQPASDPEPDQAW